ncbi:hypothetical protein [Mucilaginibacter sp.]|uniref:hypothetical protein n=1 Tax=Mucilaginibacter sp. TaxID=1882438 RepID=UPI0026101347|nr:hypothetical protein [Mucilaginibacter sp.]
MMRARKRKPFGSYDHWHFYELVLRKKPGSATLKELDELDELVNRVPAIREKLLVDMLKNDRDSTYRGGLVKWLDIPGGLTRLFRALWSTELCKQLRNRN